MSDAASAISIITVFISVLVLSSLITGGYIKALYGRTLAVEIRMNAVEKQTLDVAGELRNAMSVLVGDHRLAMSNLRDQIMAVSEQGHIAHSGLAEVIAKNHVTLVEALGKLVTRDELERAERRIMETLRKDVAHR